MPSLFNLQVRQKEHDERFHRDIYFLSQQERFKHVAYHYGKYSGRLARASIGQTKSGRLAVQELERTLIDSAIMTLNAAEIFNLDLEKILRSKYSLTDEKRTVSQLAKAVSRKVAKDYQWLNAPADPDFLNGVLFDVTEKAGIVHKACDSLDHMEGISRDTVTNAIVELLVIYLIAGDALKIDYGKTIPARWKEIETTKVL